MSRGSVLWLALAALSLSACGTVVAVDDDADGSDTGGADTGGSDAGGTDAGGTDAGGTDAGGTDAGGTDAGDDTTPVELPEWVTTSGWTTSDCADLPVDLSAGSRSYQLFCQSCHGVEGVGSTLGPIVRFPVVDFAMYVTRNGRDEQGYPGPMTAYAADALPDEDLCNILAYLRSFDEPATGEELYNTFCGSCHGEDGRGGRTGQGITREAGEASGVIRRGEGGSSFGSTGRYMPHWAADELSTAEINLIIQYINSL